MRRAMLFGMVLLVAALPVTGSTGANVAAGADRSVTLLHNPHDADRLSTGHTLITDGGYPPGNPQPPGTDGRVLEVDEDGNVVWSFADGLHFAHGAERLPNGNTLIADTGNDRVIEVDSGGTIVWDSDTITLDDGSVLSYANDVDWLTPSNHLLITDRDNHRALEITRAGHVVWQFGETGVPGHDDTHLDGPHNADRLDNGNTLIADSSNNRILEITPLGTIAWAYDPVAPDRLDWPRDADRLDNGNTLIDDSNRMRIIEVTHDKQVVWQYGDLDLPYDADRLPNGHTLISKAPGPHVIELDETGAIVWSYPAGMFDVEVPSASTSTLTGTLTVRIEAPRPGGARYNDGAPIVIWVGGGFECLGLTHGLPALASDLIILTFEFPGCTDNATGLHSDGAYDYRGADTILALSDVIRYAAGLLTDSQGRTIDQVVPVEVLHDNIGLIGTSNGGNLIAAAPALAGTDLAGHLRYLVQWETPVSSQIATRDLGRVWLKPSTAQGDYYNSRYLGYDPLLFPVDYTDLTYNDQEPYYRVFLDGSGDGDYTTIPDELTPTVPPDPDLNDDEYLDPETEDFPFDTYSDTLKVVYSRAVANALEQYSIFGGNWPPGIATVTETNTYWDQRESVRLYDEALVNVPDLEGMVLASVRDHVQSIAGKPHIRQAFEGWDGASAWVQINPSPHYMLEADPNLDPALLPDNLPNTPPPDWADPHAYCVPESISDSIYQLAAIWQMADRAHGWQVYLPAVGNGF